MSQAFALKKIIIKRLENELKTAFTRRAFRLGAESITSLMSEHTSECLYCSIDDKRSQFLKFISCMGNRNIPANVAGTQLANCATTLCATNDM